MRVPTVRGPRRGPADWQGGRGAAAAFGWRRAAVSAAVLLATAYAGLRGYERIRPTAAPAPALQTVAAAPRAIVERVSLPGTAGSARQARLSFAASSAGVSVSGTVRSIAVRTGDTVHAGQEVARLDTTSLDLAVQTARSSLAVAQLKMQTLLAGALPPEVAAAEQAVVAASTAYQKAQADLASLQGGASSGDLATATQALLTAQNALVTAQRAHAQAVESSQVASRIEPLRAQVDQLNAEQRAAMAEVDTVLAAGSGTLLGQHQREATDALIEEVRALCTVEHYREPCREAAPAASDLAALVEALEGVAPSAAGSVRAAFDQFQRVAGGESGGSVHGPLLRALRPALLLPALQGEINALVMVIALLGDAASPAPEVLANLQRSRDAAAAAVQAAEAKLNALVQGPGGAALQAARNAVDSARAALDSATAKRDQLLGGPLSTDVALQEQALVQAEIALRRALNDQAGTVLLAPFDGVVGTITMNVGEPSGTGSIILLDPKAMQLNATAQEADVARLRLGQPVALTFDAFPGADIAGRVASIAPAADVVQGVPSYAVVIEVVPGAGTGPARPAAQQLDLRAGMAGTAAVEVARHDDVLAIPAIAVRRQGRNQVVQVLAPGADEPETRTIRTGASDGAFTQVLEGLQEGDQVVIPTATTTSSAGAGGG